MSSGAASPELSEEDMLKCAVCSRDVEDAVLLKCLHSACSTCTNISVIAMVTCRVCQETTDTPTVKANLLISSLARRSRMLIDAFSCSGCIEEEKLDTTAVAWCYTCQYSLCIDCQKHQSKLHSTHKVILLNDQINLSDLYRPPAQSCAKHDEEIKFACFTCKAGACALCAHDCYCSSHDILPLDCPDVHTRMKDSATQAATLLSELNLALKALQPHYVLPEKVYHAREQSRDLLKIAKKTSIDSINNAYESASDSLLDSWNTLAVKSKCIQESAERLKTKVHWINTYCEMALNSNDIAGLLPQLDSIFSILKDRLEETRRFKEPVDPSKLVRFNTCVPRDLDSIVSGWLGLAKVVSDDFNCSLDDLPPEECTDYYNRKVSTLKELDVLLHSQREQQEIIQLERQALVKLQSEMIVKDQQLDATRNAVKKLLDKQMELQEQLAVERSKVEQLQSEVKYKTQQLVSQKESNATWTVNDTKSTLTRQRDEIDQKQLEKNFLNHSVKLIKSLTKQVVLCVADQLREHNLIIQAEYEELDLDSNTHIQAARSLVNFIIKKNNRNLYCAFIEILEHQGHNEFVRALTEKEPESFIDEFSVVRM